MWLGAAGALVLYAVPAVLQVQLGTRALSWAGVAFAAGSGVLHSVYFTTLQRGYREGDLSVVYPLARGTGPALSVLAAVLVLGERPGPLALVGAALVVLAVLSLAGRRRAAVARRARLRGGDRRHDRRSTPSGTPTRSAPCTSPRCRTSG